MEYKIKKRSKSSDVANEENSPKKLKKERTTTNNSDEEISFENKNLESNCNLNDKKRKKLQKKTIELEADTTNEEIPISVENAEYNAESKKKKKSKKEKSKIKEVKSEANDEEAIQSAQEIENDTKVKKPKKKKSKEEKRKLNESEVETNEKVEEDGEDNDADIKQKKKPSKRQLKKEKQELREKEKRDATKHETAIKVLNYISKWKHARSEWKFEKIKQAWLVNHLLDENLVPDKLYPTVLEYFEGCKGMAKEKLVQKAKTVIKEVEEKFEESGDLEPTKEYQRARQLLQTLPSET